ncbi:MAG: DUF1080 domain-containing protein [Salinibacter sp.]
MTRSVPALLLLLLFLSPARAQNEAPPNTLTEEEKENGWELLFDGKTTEGWRGYNQESFPEQGWTVRNGMLVIKDADNRASGPAGDIVTTETYDDFILKLEWKVSEEGNSGIFYRGIEQKGVALYWSAPEMQVLDNAVQPDSNQMAGSLYDLIPARPQPFTGPGTWQQAKIVADGPHVEHWLNGTKVLEYEQWSSAWYERIRNSKFKCHPAFGDAHEGRIGLQDHGTLVRFRNIKIKELEEEDEE